MHPTTPRRCCCSATSGDSGAPMTPLTPTLHSRLRVCVSSAVSSTLTATVTVTAAELASTSSGPSTVATTMAGGSVTRVVEASATRLCAHPHRASTSTVPVVTVRETATRATNTTARRPRDDDPTPTVASGGDEPRLRSRRSTSFVVTTACTTTATGQRGRRVHRHSRGGAVADPAGSAPSRCRHASSSQITPSCGRTRRDCGATTSTADSRRMVRAPDACMCSTATSLHCACLRTRTHRRH
jgi:hypothetical protein